MVIWFCSYDWSCAQVLTDLLKHCDKDSDGSVVFEIKSYLRISAIKYSNKKGLNWSKPELQRWGVWLAGWALGQRCVCECLLEQVKKVLQGQAFPHATGTNLQSPGYFISYLKNQQNSANFIENKYFQMTALVIYTVPNTLLLKPLTFRSPLTLGGLGQLKLTSLLLHCFTKWNAQCVILVIIILLCYMTNIINI